MVPVSGGPQDFGPPERPWRPLWWWFVIHGAIVAAWGSFVLLTPWRGYEAWLIDGVAFGVMLVLAGTQLIVQGPMSRRYGRGWLGLTLGGICGIVFAAACFIAAAFGSADALFWVVIVFYVVEGLVFILGTSGGPIFRYWGLLMGGIIYAALVTLLTLRFTIDQNFELLDTVWGALGLLYGIAMIAAAVQVRYAAIAEGDSTR